MRQVFTVRRIVTFKLEVDVVQPLAKATLEGLVNTQVVLGAPTFGKIVSQEVTPFVVLKTEPSCECSAPKARRGKQ
jgi:hypothetical protein